MSILGREVIENMNKAEKILEGLNEEQRLAASTVDGAVRLIAGAGSGKTFTLTKRVAYICESRGIEPSRVLSLTFTNKAAAEMRSRVAKVMGLPEEQFNMMTFHSLALDIVKEDKGIFGWDKVEIMETPIQMLVALFLRETKEIKEDISQLSDDDRKAIEVSLAKKLRYARSQGYYAKWLDKKASPKVPLASVSDVLKEVQDYNEEERLKKVYKDNIKTMVTRINEGFCKKYRKVITMDTLQDDWKAYTIYKENRVANNGNISAIDTWLRRMVGTRKNKCSFDDMLNLAVYLLETYPEIKEKWSNKYDYIQVDEFQDTDSKQLKIVKMLYERHGNLFVVGDPDQSIYLFRGAEPTLFNKLEEHIPNLQTIFMKFNYRSSDEIVKISDEVIKLNKNRIDKCCESQVGKGNKTIILTETTDTEIAEREADIICDYIKQGRKPNEIAVLYRSKTDTVKKKLQEILEKKGIAVNIEEEGDIIYDFTYNICKYKYTDDISFLMKAIMTVTNFNNDRDFKCILDPYKYEGILLDEMSIFNVIRELLCLTATKAKVEVLNTSPDKIINVASITKALTDWTFLSAEEKVEACIMSDVLDDGSMTDIKNDGVNILTMHKSKGLEYPIVFVNGLNTTVLESNTDTFEVTEETARLAYVAYSRAKEQLYLSHYAFIEKSNGDLVEIKPHAVLSQVIDMKEAVVDRPLNSTIDVDKIKEDGIKAYQERLETKFKPYYTPLKWKEEIVGYRYTISLNGELVGFQADIKDLERLDCVPSDKYMTIILEKPIEIRVVDKDHYFAFDEIGKTIKIYDCKTDDEIKAIFEKSSDTKYDLDIKDDATMQKIRGYVKGIGYREISSIKEDNIVEVEGENTVDVKSKKKERVKVVYYKIIDEKGNNLGVRLKKGSDTLDISVEEIKKDKDKVRKLLEKAEYKGELTIKKKNKVKLEITYAEFNAINKALREERNANNLRISLVRILDVDTVNDKVDTIVTSKWGNNIKSRYEIEELVRSVMSKQVCLSNPSAIMQWRKWKKE